MSNYIIGVSGGIASGKSTIAALFDDLGCHVINADIVAHEIMHLPENLKEICKIFGDDIFVKETYFKDLFPGNFVDRKIIRDQCVEDPSKLTKLNELLHEKIKKEIFSLTRENVYTKNVVWDIPLLYEQNYDLLCDFVVFVDSPYETRLARATSGRNWSKEHFDFMESKQVSLEYKRSKADYVFWNDGSYSFVKNILERMKTGDKQCK